MDGGCKLADRLGPMKRDLMDILACPEDKAPLTLDAAEEAGLRRFNYHHQGNLSAGEWVVISDKCGKRWDPRTSDWEPVDDLVL